MLPCRVGTIALILLASLGTVAVMAMPLALAAEPVPRNLIQASPGNFTTEQLKSFAAATLQVERLGDKWTPRIAAADGPSQEEKLRLQAMDELSKAIRRHGLTVDEYNRIKSAVQIDPDTARIVEDYRREMR